MDKACIIPCHEQLKETLVLLCKCLFDLPARLVTGLHWMVAVLLLVDASLAVDSLSLTDVDLTDYQ